MHFGTRELIFFIVLFSVPLAAYYFVFMPKNAQITAAREEVQVKMARLDKLAEVVSRIDDIGLAIEAGQESIAMIEAKLPSERDVEGILQQIWEIAERSSLTVRSVKSEPPVPAAMYMELPLRVVMDGQFDGFYQFLLELEKLPRITRIHNMELKRGQAAATTRQGRNAPPVAELPPGWMRAEFLLSIYFESSVANGRATH